MPYTTQESKQNYKQKMLCKTYHVFQKKHAPSYKTYHANYHHHHYCRHRSRLHILLLLLLPATNSSQVHSSVFYIFLKKRKQSKYLVMMIMLAMCMAIIRGMAEVYCVFYVEIALDYYYFAVR